MTLGSAVGKEGSRSRGEGAGVPVSSVPQRDQKMLWGAAAGRCSYPRCAKRLVADRSKLESEVILGEMAHIIPKSPGGPRGEFAISEDERNRYRNLILLCEDHHKLVDSQRKTYPPETLRKFKEDHERLCQGPFGEPLILPQPLRPWVTDQVFSTVLPVGELPRRVYSAEAVVADEHVVKAESMEMLGRRPPPFIVREGRIFAFDDLGDDTGPFSRWVRPHTTRREAATDMWEDHDRARYYVALLNAVLRKLAGARGLQMSNDDNHWYFPPGPGGAEVTKAYQPLNKPVSERKVAWQPTVRASGEKKKYWEHLAVGLRFVRIAPASWVLALRPERHFTLDGVRPLSSAGSARRSTARASRMYNDDVLEDANFWRSYLAEGKPRILWRFGPQVLLVEARLLDTSVTWPGVPDDVRRYTNAQPVDDLFSRAELAEFMEEQEFGDEEADDE